MLKIRDFWPPIQGGWDNLDGVFVPVESVVKSWRLPIDDPDLIAAEDESDIHGYLEDMAAAKQLQAPERVVWLSQEKVRPSTAVAGIKPGYYAYWPKGAVLDFLPCCEVIGSLAVAYAYPRFIPAGVGLLGWVLVLIAVIVFWVR
jgi:hypothetical protein